MAKPTRSVFLSSTFSDFIMERKLLIEAIPYIDMHVNCAERKGNSGKCLEMSIKDWIDESDMVVILISSKYGTEPRPSQSWTQKEFEYAREAGKQIFAYIREIPDDMKQYIDIDHDKKAKLEQFIELVQNNIGVVPRYQFGENHRLIAMVIRDLERCKSRLDNEDEQKKYVKSFVS